MYGDVVLAAVVYLVIGTAAHAITRTGVRVTFHVPIEVQTEVALNLGLVALSVSALVATGVAALGGVLGLSQGPGWALGGMVAAVLLGLCLRRFGMQLLSREVDFVRARRRARQGLPPLVEGPPRHSR